MAWWKYIPILDSKAVTIYSLKICYSPRTRLETYVKGCGRSDRVISEFYLKDIFVTSFKNDVLYQKLDKEFNPSPQVYAYSSKFFGKNSVFLLVLKESRMPPIRNEDIFFPDY